MFSDPLFARGLVVALGILLVVWGGRLYQVVVLAPGLVGGIWGGWALGQVLSLGSTPTLAICGVLALGGALVCHFVENLAVRLTGATAFAALGWLGWPLVRPILWEAGVAALVGAAVGALVFPKIYGVAVRVATAGLGGMALAYAAGEPSNLWIIGGAALVGTVVQSVPWSRGKVAAKPKAKEKKK
jgi:hypothetical protein